ncbi:hypothetical protein HK103_002575 [Boothiomyces macroporosus]|uniref:Uncharacterized protein n=1 Tax=Boothiomyces macroporosus TaxID=261099 RepID=A0AAD5Y0A7_9FUNG|nr:hypothetical protein HK103_002575 [Boothiomyces macroporosus]
MACSIPETNPCSPYTDFKLDFSILSHFYNQKVVASNWHLLVRNTSWIDFLGCDIDPKYSATYNCFTDIYVLSQNCNQPKKICDSVCEGYGNSVIEQLKDCKNGYQERIDFMTQAERICKEYSSPSDCLSPIAFDSKLKSQGNMMDQFDPQYSFSYLFYGSIFGILVVGGLILVAFKLHRKTEEIVLTNRESRMSFSSLAFSTFERPLFDKDREIPLEEMNENEKQPASMDNRLSYDQFQNIPLDDEPVNIMEPFSKTPKMSTSNYPVYPSNTEQFNHSYIAGVDCKGKENELSFSKGDQILFVQMGENGIGEAINVRTYQKGLASMDLMTLESVRNADEQINPFRNPSLSNEEMFRTHSTLLRNFLLKNVGVGGTEIVAPVNEGSDVLGANSSVKDMFRKPVDGVGTGETLLNQSFD